MTNIFFRTTEEAMSERMSVCGADLTTLVPLLMTCMSTLQVPFECEMRLTSENSAYEDGKRTQVSLFEHIKC